MMFFAAEESFMDHLTPKALNPVLGWTIVGTSSHQLPTTAETLLVQTPTLDDDFFHQVQNWMRLDNEIEGSYSPQIYTQHDIFHKSHFYHFIIQDFFL